MKFPFAELIEEQKKIEKRQAERARLQAALLETVDPYVSDLPLSTGNRKTMQEHILCPELNQRLLGALSRIGADVIVEKGYRFLKCARVERPFDKGWVDQNVYRMRGLEGLNPSF